MATPVTPVGENGLPFGTATNPFVTSGSSGPAIGGTVTDQSDTITLGGSSQTLMAQNDSRRGGAIQNQSTGDLWIRATMTAAATQPSFVLPAGSFVTLDEFGITTEQVRIYGATTGQAFAAREW